MMRGRHGSFPEYHTSADNLEFVSGRRMAQSLETLSAILGVVDRDRVLRNLEPYGEPQLGSRGLYAALGGEGVRDIQLAMLWVLNLSDGAHSLLDIAERSGIDFSVIDAAASVLEEHDLLGPPSTMAS
jgi:aminopeptidase-like protein